MMNARKKGIGNEQGFTLVEILVVLVILAILAAISIPSMKGFIDDANKKAYLVHARSVYVACQAAATELSVSSDTPAESDVKKKAKELLADEVGGDFTMELEGSKVLSITYQPEDSEDITIHADGEVTYQGDR